MSYKANCFIHIVLLEIPTALFFFFFKLVQKHRLKKTESISWLNHMNISKGLFEKLVIHYFHESCKALTPVNHESYWKYSV